MYTTVLCSVLIEKTATFYTTAACRIGLIAGIYDFAKLHGFGTHRNLVSFYTRCQIAGEERPAALRFQHAISLGLYTKRGDAAASYEWTDAAMMSWQYYKQCASCGGCNYPWKPV